MESDEIKEKIIINEEEIRIKLKKIIRKCLILISSFIIFSDSFSFIKKRKITIIIYNESSEEIKEKTIH